MQQITTLLQKWYAINKRDLPWRKTKDPYKIWLSEIILQQTQVAQGMSYYQKFIKTYPNVYTLANSQQDTVLKNWQGLGYYSRARNLHFAAKQIVNEFDGQFPKTYNDIKKLKGVGDYTAAAIASFSYNEPTAVVDGNVFRVLSRLFAIGTPINSTLGKKEFSKLADSIIDKKNPADHNQAIMELGALVCRPKNPQCESCPIQFHCESLRLKSVLAFPVKTKKIKVKSRFLNYMLITDGQSLLVNKRNEKGIWQGLYDFPLLETEESVNSITKFENLNGVCAKFDIEIKHILTHQHLYVKFWIIEIDDLKRMDKYEVIKINDLEDLPLPQLFVRYINQSDFFKR